MHRMMNRYKVLFFFIAIAGFSSRFAFAAQPNAGGIVDVFRNIDGGLATKFVMNGMKEGAEGLQKLAEINRQHAMSRARREIDLSAKIAEIKRAHEEGRHDFHVNVELENGRLNQSCGLDDIGMLEYTLSAMRKANENTANREDTVMDGFTTAVATGSKKAAEVGAEMASLAVQTVAHEFQANVNLRNQLALGAQQGRNSRKMLKQWLNVIKDPKKLFMFVLAAICVIGGAATLYYLAKHGIPLLMRQLEEYLGRPPIIKETSRVSFYEKMRALLAGAKKTGPALSMDDVIASPELKAKLTGLLEYITNAYKNGDMLPNLLLYGPPGTGKTYWATIAAKMSGLHYAIIPGSSFAKVSTAEALKIFCELLSWAKHSDKPIMLVIDEAETFLGNRQESSEGYRKLVTEFLAQVDKAADKKLMFMLISNLPNDLDIAVLSRMARKIRFPRPDAKTLEGLMALYAQKVKARGIELDPGLIAAYKKFAQPAKERKKDVYSTMA